MKNKKISYIKIYLFFTFLLFLLLSWEVYKFAFLNIIGKILIIGLILFVYLIFVKMSFKLKKKKKVKIIIIILIIVNIIAFLSFLLLLKVNTTLNNLGPKNSVTYKTNFLVLNDSKIKKIKDIDNKIIGLLNDENSYESYLIPTEVLSSEEIDVDIKYVESYSELINGIIEGNYDVIAVPNEVEQLFDFDKELIDKMEKLRIIHTSTKVVKNINEKVKEIKSGEPFSILLIGTDSKLETQHHNYDVIILLTFNPKNNDLVVTSVYRATGMYSNCIKGFDLVNHNGWKGWGPSCLKETIGNFFDIDINNYVMVDFNGFVDIVDALNGIETEVIKDFCEQDSNRNWGKNTICLKAGKQNLNGEQALAFARHRMSYEGEGGVVRSKNHVTIIKDIAKKILSKEGLLKFDQLLNVLERNVETDMSAKQMSTLYNIMIDIAKKVNYNLDKINIISFATEGYGEMLYSPAMNTTVGISLIYEEVYENIYNAFQSVVNNKPFDLISHSFDLSNDPNYVNPTIKSDLLKQVIDPRIMPNFVGKTEFETRNYFKKYLYFNLKTEYVNSSTVPKGEVIKQSIPSGQSFDSRYNMTITVSKGSEEKVYSLPNTTNWTYQDVISYINKTGLKNYFIEKYTITSSEKYKHNDFVKFDSKTIENDEISPSYPVTFYIASNLNQVKNVPPIIELKGSKTITLEVGDKYVEPGYTAFDEIDWNITKNVVVTGSVDTELPGTFVITYSITNSNGINTVVEREIIVK